MFGEHVNSSHSVDLRRSVLREKTAHDNAKVSEVQVLRRTVETLKNRVNTLERHQRVINVDAFDLLCRRVERLESAHLEYGFHGTTIHGDATHGDVSIFGVPRTRAGSPARARGMGMSDDHGAASGRFHGGGAYVPSTHAAAVLRGHDDEDPAATGATAPLARVWVEEVCDRANIVMQAARDQATAAMSYAFKALQLRCRARDRIQAFGPSEGHSHHDTMLHHADESLSPVSSAGAGLEDLAVPSFAVSPVRNVPMSADTSYGDAHRLLPDLTATAPDTSRARRPEPKLAHSRAVSTDELPLSAGPAMVLGPSTGALELLESRADSGDWLCGRLLVFLRGVAKSQVEHEAVEWTETLASAGSALMSRAVSWFDVRAKPVPSELQSLARGALAACAILTVDAFCRTKADSNRRVGFLANAGQERHVDFGLVTSVATLASAVLAEGGPITTSMLQSSGSANGGAAADVSAHNTAGGFPDSRPPPHNSSMSGIRRGNVSPTRGSVDGSAGASRHHHSPTRSAALQLAERVSALLPSAAPRSHLRFSGQSLPNHRPPLPAGAATLGGLSSSTAGSSRSRGRSGTPPPPTVQGANRGASPFRDDFYFTSRRSSSPAAVAPGGGQGTAGAADRRPPPQRFAPTTGWR